jgi:hypothetical protein
VVQLTELQHQEAAWNRSVLLQCDMGLQLPWPRKQKQWCQ